MTILVVSSNKASFPSQTDHAIPAMIVNVLPLSINNMMLNSEESKHNISFQCILVKFKFYIVILK